MNTQNQIKTVLTLAGLAMATLAASANAANGGGELGILTPETLAGNNPATGAPWVVGDTYRFAFVSSATTQATSTDINYYNTFLQNLADASSLGLSGATWKVIGSTSTVDARDNTSTNPGVNGTGEAIFLVDGATVIANNYSDLWDGNLDHALNMDENGTGGLTGRTHVGTNGNGTKRARCLGGSTETPPKVETGEMHDPGGHWLVQYNSAATSSHSIYAMSDPLTIGTGDPNLPSVDAGADMISWWGQAVVLDPNVVEAPGSDWTSLTYLWSAVPDDGVEFSDPDALAPTVTITKATDNPSVVTLTLAVNNVGRIEPPVEDTMTIDIYDDACLAAEAAGPVEYDPTDIDGNCITNFADFAVMATTWLDDYTLTAPEPK